MYTLTLTAGERRAIDWIGNRYDHGTDLKRLLWGGDCVSSPYEAEWSGDEDISFSIPENVAWQIGEMGAANEYRWDCFADELSAKLTDFCFAIV